MENLKITLIQPDIIWEDVTANLEKYAKWMEKIGSTDVIILPEMFTTGFSMNPKKLNETMDGNSVRWMKKTARDKDASVLGSLIIKDGDRVYNRAVWVFPDGSFKHYDKRHLFTLGQENLHYSSGNKKTVIEYKGWRFCPLICYDLRFPVWGRNAENYDVLIYIANWPSPRLHHWKTLLQARAVENQSVCIGVNRTGNDGAGLNYSGGSGLIKPDSTATFLNEEEIHQTFEINYSELHDYREKFPFLNDRDKFRIKQ